MDSGKQVDGKLPPFGLNTELERKNVIKNAKSYIMEIEHFINNLDTGDLKMNCLLEPKGDSSHEYGKVLHYLKSIACDLYYINWLAGKCGTKFVHKRIRTVVSSPGTYHYNILFLSSIQLIEEVLLLCKGLIDDIKVSIDDIHNGKIITLNDVPINLDINIKNAIEAIKNYKNLHKVGDDRSVSSEASTSGTKARPQHVNNTIKTIGDYINLTVENLHKVDDGRSVSSEASIFTLVCLEKQNIKDNGKILIQEVREFLNDYLNNPLLVEKGEGKSAEPGEVADCLRLVVCSLVYSYSRAGVKDFRVCSQDGTVMLDKRGYEIELNEKSAYAIDSFQFDGIYHLARMLCNRLIVDVQLCIGGVECAFDFDHKPIEMDTRSFNVDFRMNLQNAIKVIKNYINTHKVHEGGLVSSETKIREEVSAPSTSSATHRAHEYELVPIKTKVSDAKAKSPHVKKRKHTDKEVSEASTSLATHKVHEVRLVSSETKNLLSCVVRPVQAHTQSINDSRNSYLYSTVARILCTEDILGEGKSEVARRSLQNLTQTSSSYLPPLYSFGYSQSQVYASGSSLCGPTVTCTSTPPNANQQPSSSFLVPLSFKQLAGCSESQVYASGPSFCGSMPNLTPPDAHQPRDQKMEIVGNPPDAHQTPAQKMEIAGGSSQEIAQPSSSSSVPPDLSFPLDLSMSSVRAYPSAGRSFLLHACDPLKSKYNSTSSLGK